MQWIWCFSSSLAGAPEQYAALLERARFRLVNDIDGVRCHYSGSCACLRTQREPWCQLRVICVVLAMCGLRSVFPGGLNRSPQHFILKGKEECGMEWRFHRGFTAAEKTELWDRWKRGESLKAIGRAFGKQSSSIYFLVAPHGGIRRAERRRSRLALTLAEREVISRGVTAHRSARSIAKLLGRSPSTVSREMSCNGGYDRYRAALADENAWARSRRPMNLRSIARASAFRVSTDRNRRELRMREWPSIVPAASKDYYTRRQPLRQVWHGVRGDRSQSRQLFPKRWIDSLVETIFNIFAFLAWPVVPSVVKFLGTGLLCLWHRLDQQRERLAEA